MQTKQSGNATVGLIGGVIGLIILIMITFATFEQVGEHEYAISVEDGVVSDVLEPGINLTNPFLTDVVSVPSTLQERQVKGIDAGSRDNFNVKGSVVEYTYRIPKGSAIELYKNYPDWDTVIKTQVNAVTKNILGQYRMVDIPRNRAKIGGKIKERLQARIGDDLGVRFIDASLADYGWGQDAKNQIRSIKQAENERDVEQEKLQTQKLKNKRLAEKQEAELERQRKRQEAANKRKISKSEAEAEAELNRIQAEAKGMRTIAKVLEDNPALLKRETIQTWDGKLPRVSGSSEIKLSVPSNFAE